MTVRKGTKVHPASFEIVLKLKDRWGFTYEDLSDLLDVTPSRVQQIVLHQRKRGLDDVDSCSSSEQAKEWSATTS
jgi:predicted transcriptional regulator